MRYYYEPMKEKKWWLWHEVVTYKNLLATAMRLPFNSRLSRQQVAGERKSKWQMVKENLLWTLKYKEVCYYYFLYGLDVKGHNPDDYMGYTEFRVLRNIINFRQRENKFTRYTFNYLSLVRDKFVFYQYCKSLGMPHPRTIALISGGLTTFNIGGGWQSLDSMTDVEFVGFCKETTGEAGIGAFSLEVNNGNMRINGQEATIDQLRERVGAGTYIVQERLENHQALRKIYPQALNTLRLVTILKDDGEVDFFSGVQRFGANGSVVDNGYAGGIFVGVSENGVLNNYGCHEPHTGNEKLIVFDKHPNTHEQFGGMKLPHWEEIMETARRFHKFMYGIPSIGWDVAITEDGFCFTEAGEDWEIAFDQAANGPQRERFYKYHGYALGIKLRKY